MSNEITLTRGDRIPRHSTGAQNDGFLENICSELSRTPEMFDTSRSDKRILQMTFLLLRRLLIKLENS